MAEEAIRRALSALADGASYKLAFESLLVDVSERRSEELMLLHNESRGAWVPLLSTRVGRALFVGHPLSGGITPLASSDLDVTVCFPDFDWLRFGRARGADQLPAEVRAVAADPRKRLPFQEHSFDLVVVEACHVDVPRNWRAFIDELARVAKGEVVLLVDNRLAYKHSKGRRGEYDVPHPLRFVARGIAPDRGQLTLRGYRRALNRHFEQTGAFALYPDARDFSHVVGLDSDRPRLTIGPRERGNRIKLLAKRCGLFPLLTPSFAVLAGKQRAQPRIESVLRELAERLGEPCPNLEMLVATRSNCAVMHTEIRGASNDEPEGRWTLHLPLNPKKQGMLEHHFATLKWVTEEFPGVPVPTPLFAGEVDGVWLTCERRLAGLSFPHLTGNKEATRRTFLDVVNQFSKAVVEPRARIEGELYEQLIGRRFRVVRDKARVPATVDRLRRMEDEVKERILGKEMPLVLYHADMRSKHIQVTEEGQVLGYLDWGTSERAFLPYVDVMHMVTHQRKHEGGGLVGEPWRILRERAELADHELEAIERYLGNVGLDEDSRSALELMLPVLVAGMAELNWDYSRPLWVHRQFGL